MTFRMTETGLECRDGDDWLPVGGWIHVIARTRDAASKAGFGALIEWKNVDNITQNMIVFSRVLYGEQSREIRDLLLDAGYWLEPHAHSWPRLRMYLLQEIVRAPTGVCVNETGWHDELFVTPDWSVGCTDSEPYYYAGRRRDPVLSRSGTLAQWQSQVGELCVGNPLMIIAVGVALAAPLLHPSGVENGIFHLVGPSSTGKTSLLELAASVYGDRHYVRSWISTANGLAAVAAEQHDMLLALDELGLARPEDADVAVYHIVAGASKLRATRHGGLATPTHWRTLALSSGEVWLSEILASLGKKPRAGQQIRLVEIPVFGRYGAFSELHDFSHPQPFVDHLKMQMILCHGTLFPEWVSLLTSLDQLSDHVQSKIRLLVEEWRTSQMSSQVERVLQRFALVATALALASRYHLVPWEESESIDSVRRVWLHWLAARGHSMNGEEHRVLCCLRELLPQWERMLEPLDQHHACSSLGYTRVVDGEPQWLIDKNQFLQQLGLSSQYLRDVMPLLQREWLATNEQERATLKLMINGKFIRFFALWPERVYAQIQELLQDG